MTMQKRISGVAEGEGKGAGNSVFGHSMWLTEVMLNGKNERGGKKP